MSEAALEQFRARRADREHEQRTFEIDGERLTVKAGIAPEIALNLADIRAKVAAHAAAAVKASEQGNDIPPAPFTDQDLLDVAEQTARACLTPESFPAWERLRDPARPSPFTLADIYWLCDHMIARASGFPTEPPAASSNGSGSTAGSSKGGSSSKAAGRKR